MDIALRFIVINIHELTTSFGIYRLVLTLIDKTNTFETSTFILTFVIIYNYIKRPKQIFKLLSGLMKKIVSLSK